MFTCERKDINHEKHKDKKLTSDDVSSSNTASLVVVLFEVRLRMACQSFNHLYTCADPVLVVVFAVWATGLHRQASLTVGF